MIDRKPSPAAAPILAARAAAVACAATPHGNAPASATTRPATHDTVRLADAVPLKQILPEEWTANLTDQLDTPEVADTTYFGELDSFDDDADQNSKPIDAIPILARKDDDGTWSAVPLLGAGTKQAGWRYVAAGPRPKEVWGAIDTVTDDDRGNFVLAHSTDGGETFTLQVLHKPCKLAAFYDFVMSRSGLGRASLSLDTDCGLHKAGVYHFETTDDGKTWSPTPRYEPDAMVRADSVADDDQPDAANGGAPQRSSLHGHAGQRVPLLQLTRLALQP